MNLLEILLYCIRPLGLMDAVGSVFGKADTPETPNYSQAADKTSASSVQASIANQLLNRPNENTPYGTRAWEQTGTQTVPGIGGLPAQNIPQYTANTTLSPTGQKLFDLESSLKLGLGNQAQSTLGQVQNATAAPVDFSSAPKAYNEADLLQNRDAVTNAMYSRAKSMLDPQFQQQQDSLDTNLVNRGFALNTPGYNTAQGNFDRTKQAAYGDARDRAILAGGDEQSRLFGMGQADRQRAIQELLLQRQLPMTELSSLMTGAAPAMPNFQSYSSTANSQGGNYLGATAAEQAARLQSYGLESERSNMIHNGIMDIWGGAMGKF